jgi:hypothetical protein
MSSRPVISRKKSSFGAVDSDSEDEFDVDISAVVDAMGTTERSYRAIPTHHSENDDEEYPTLDSSDDSDADDKGDEGNGAAGDSSGGEREDMQKESKGKAPARKQVRRFSPQG